MHPKSAEGMVVSVALRAGSGVPKYPQAEVRIGEHGVEGDWHAGPVNKHKKRGAPEPNHRMLTVVAKEALDKVNAELGIELGPGSIGENILVDDLGHLASLVEGDLLAIGDDVVLRVTGQNAPCATLNVHQKDIVKALIGIRGVTAVVEAVGVVRPAIESCACTPRTSSCTHSPNIA